ncbi:MAG: hypothetical protein HZA36_03055 [Parcubacteria group bacterium]|nr:hypothetical protein [Parcubacteria group bacterium]
MKLVKITSALSSLAAFVLASPVWAIDAQTTPSTFYSKGDLEPLTKPSTLITSLSTLFTNLFLAISIWFFFLAGYKYMTAGGDQEKFTEARKNMVYAMIGLVVGLGAYAMPQIIAIFLGNAKSGF